MLKEIDISSLSLKPFEKIGKEWMLITAGNEEKHNTMTASWGGLGVLFGKNVSFIFVRPQRYTKEFVDSNDGYSLCFFDESYRKALNLCGTASGRDIDKDKECGFTVDFIEGVPYYKEAKLVIICKKVYQQTMEEKCFLNEKVLNNIYPEKDFHDIYVGEIVKILSE